MRKIWLAFIFICTLSTSYTQEIENDATSHINGKVTDSLADHPIEYATITLYKKGEKKTVNGAATNKQGNFSITNVAFGDYTAVAEAIGYLAVTINNIHVEQKHTVITLPDIVLVKTAVSLQNVTVTATARLIDNKIDKLVFNAEKDLTSQTGVATDILKKVPQVSVDVDGNVELAGSSSVRFLINGKPSTIYGSSINEVLQSIPASQVKSIEVITNPGARYDAQGLGGIINIILKKSTAQGINGNLSITGGTRNDNGSFNFNARKGKFGVNAFFSGNTRPLAKTLNSSNRLSTDSSTAINLQQDAINKNRRHGYQAGIGFDWTIKEKTSISGSLSLENFGNNSYGITNQSQIITDKTNPSTVLSTINVINNTSNHFSNRQMGAEINYKRNFNKEDQELEVNASTSFGKNSISAANSQFLSPQDSMFYGTSNINTGNEKETEITLDYTQPFSENIKFGVGGKTNIYDIRSNSDALRFQPLNGQYLQDISLSNSLDYKQKVYAAYAELAFPVARLFDVKVGGRYERTETHSFYSNANQQVNTRGYNTLVPSLFILKKLGDKQNLKLSYSKRIERPDYNDLNPYINTSDPTNIVAGNPYLRPEIGNRLELSYNHDLGSAGSFIITLFYRQNHDDIQPFIVYFPLYKVGDSTYTNVSVTTRENIGLEKNMGASLFGDLHVTSKLSLRSNLFFFYRHIINAIDKGFNSNSFNYRFNLNATYQFDNTLVAEFFGNFNSSRHQAQGKYPSFTTYSFAVRKQFWNKKGSLALTAINPFSKYVRQETNLFGPNFNVAGIRRIPFRSIGINFTWKFGRLVFKKEDEGNQEIGNLNPPED